MQVLERAIELTKTLPAGLREAQDRAILAMLGEPLLAYLKELSMDMKNLEDRAFRVLKWLDHPSLKAGLAQGLAKGEAQGLARGMAEGRRSALLALLSARGLTPSVQERDRIEAAGDAGALLECVQCAATATTVAEALAPLRSRRKPSPRPRRPRTAAKKEG